MKPFDGPLLSTLIFLAACKPCAAGNCAAPGPPRGAPAPKYATTGTVHYVDPVNGHDSNALTSPGTGTRANPWKTLSEVIAHGNLSTSPTQWNVITGHKTCTITCVAPGDTILLLTGNHGAVLIQGYYGARNPLVGYDNDASPILIEAAPGAIPVVTSLTLRGGNGFTFRGITFESRNLTGRYLGPGNKDFYLVSLAGPHNLITFDHDTFKSQDTPFTTTTDWAMYRASGVQDIGGTNIAITNSLFRYIGFGIAFQSGSHMTITGNTIDYFADDGIDYGSDNVLISGNTITNSVEDGDGFHRDGMQGQPINENTTISNVTITNNTIVRDEDPANPFPGYLQGIDDFDGLQANFTITGNTVSTDATHGISFYGPNGITIAHNSLIKDGGRVKECAVTPPLYAYCAIVPVVVDTSLSPAILVHKSKPNSAGVQTLPSNVIIDGNVTQNLNVPKAAINAIVKNNICHLKLGKCYFSAPLADGVYENHYTVGSYGKNNIIEP